MAARACHQYEIEILGQSGLKGLDDWWTVSHCFLFLPAQSHYAGGISDFVLLLTGRDDTGAEPVEKRGCMWCLREEKTEFRCVGTGGNSYICVYVCVCVWARCVGDSERVC